MSRKRKGRSSLSKVSRRAKATKRKRKNPGERKNAALVGNPPIWSDLWHDVVPGIGAYAATRLAGRIAFKIGKRKSMRFARHVGPWTSVAVAGMAWLGMHFFVSEETAKRYHTPVIVGSFLAAVQGIFQTYVPQWGWLLNDYHLDDGKMLPGSPVPAPAPDGQTGAPPPQGQYAEADMDELAAVLNDGENENDLRTGIFAS